MTVFGVTLDELRAERWAEIDAEAEVCRLRYVTPGSGQAMVYEAKLREARAVLAGEPDAALAPFLAAEAAAQGVSLIDKASQVAAAAARCRAALIRIDGLRVAGKRAVAAAASAADIRLPIQWERVDE